MPSSPRGVGEPLPYQARHRELRVWRRILAGYYLGKTAVVPVTQLPGALDTSVLVCLSHAPIAGKGVVPEEAARGLGFPGWHSSLL